MATLPRLYAGPTAAFSPEFDTVYGITADGRILAPDGLYLPTVEHSDVSDVLIDGVGLIDGPGPVTEWQALTGHTGQHGYRGAVMHPSEQWGAWAIEDLCRLADAPDVAYLAFAVVPVLDGDDFEAEPVGWAVIYREMSA